MMVPSRWSLSQTAVALVVIAAVCAILWFALGAMGIVIPQFVVVCFWIIVIAVVAVLAIRFVASL